MNRIAQPIGRRRFLKAVPAAVQELLARSGRALDSVDHFVFHQANKYMLDRLRAKLGIDPARFSLELESCGNTVSSTIPIALERAALPEGKDVMLVGFGVGYSWAAAMMRTV